MYAQSHQVRSKSSYTLKAARFAQSQQVRSKSSGKLSHQVRSKSSGTFKVIRFAQNHQVRSVIRNAQSSGSLKVIRYAQSHQVRSVIMYAQSHHVRSKSSCSLKVNISDSFGSKKRLNRIIKLGLGRLCPMEENLSFINNYIIYDLAG